MDDILTGKIPKPPGMTISTRPSPLDKLLKSVKSDMASDRKQKEVKSNTTAEASSTIFQCQPPSNKPPPLFEEANLQNVESSNKHKSNPKKYPLSNEQIFSLQHNGYVVIDDFISNQAVIQSVQNEIDLMNKLGKMKQAGIRKLNGQNNRNNIEISKSACTEINGIYQMHKMSEDPHASPIQLLVNDGFIIISDVYYLKDDAFAMVQIETTQKLKLFVETKMCWIICKYLPNMQFPIIYYVASDECKLTEAKWQCIGGIEPFGSLAATNKWMSSSVRNDLHCWLHSDDKDIGKSLKQCIISMDEIRVQLNKVVGFGSNTTQVQCTLYPGKGAKYVTHIDEPPNVNKKGPKRRVTCLLYFNLFGDDQWTEKDHGGCLRMHLGEGKYEDIEPIGGRLVVFNSQWLPHQVMPCYFNRYAVTLWMY